MNAPAGGTVCPKSLRPQQATVPSVRTAQVWALPALTCATVPGVSRTNAGFASRSGLVRSDSQAMAKASPNRVGRRIQSIVTVVSSLLAQPFVQHQEQVEPLAVIAHAVTVLARHGANSVGVEPSGIAQARTLRQLIGPSAGRPTPEPHLQWRGKAVLGSLEQLGREGPLQQRLEQRLSAAAVPQPPIPEAQRGLQHLPVPEKR